MIQNLSNIFTFFKRILPSNIMYFLAFSLMTSSLLEAQPNTNEQLAVQYFQDKEYEKAAILFEDIYNAKPTPFVYDYYFKCLVELKDYKKAEKFIVKTIKKQPLNIGLGVDLGYIYLLEQEDDKAKKQFETTIKQLTSTTIDLSSYPKGIYFLTVKSNNTTILNQKIITE